MSCPPSYVQEHLSMYREKEAGNYKSQNREFRECYMPMRELSVQKWDVHPVFCVLLDGTIMISKTKQKQEQNLTTHRVTTVVLERYRNGEIYLTDDTSEFSHVKTIES